METSLHRQLKAIYGAENSGGQEVRVETFRIDAIRDGRLIEIQQASLAALRHKVRTLLARHDVTVVKPLAAEKLLVRRGRDGKKVVSTRKSPKRETLANLFVDLVHFVDVFPHPRLSLEVILTRQEEDRLPIRRRWWRGRDYRVIDRRLVAIEDRRVFNTAADLLELLPPGLGDSFSTEELARRAEMPRWLAQKMAYCLRKTGGLAIVGKQGNAHLYRVVKTAQSGRKRRAA